MRKQTATNGSHAKCILGDCFRTQFEPNVPAIDGPRHGKSRESALLHAGKMLTFNLREWATKQ